MPPLKACGRTALATRDMRFSLIDRIIELRPGEKITTSKCVALSEDYLQDHFPKFPVLPGVLMLEAMTESSAWLVRVSEDFAHSMVVLAEARNIKYADFVQPGKSLMIEAELLKQDQRQTKLKVWGTVDGRVAVSARLVLERYNLVEENPLWADTDRSIVRQMRQRLAILDRTASQASDQGDGNRESGEPRG